MQGERLGSSQATELVVTMRLWRIARKEVDPKKENENPRR